MQKYLSVPGMVNLGGIIMEITVCRFVPNTTDLQGIHQNYDFL